MSARYDYECNRCGVMEITHGMNENRCGRECPVCGGELEPLVVGVQLSARAEFKKYHLENGNLKKVQDHPNFEVVDGRRGIWIESKRQENEIMDKMECRFAESGDALVGGIKHGEKPDKPLHIRR